MFGINESNMILIVGHHQHVLSLNMIFNNESNETVADTLAALVVHHGTKDGIYEELDQKVYEKNFQNLEVSRSGAEWS